MADISALGIKITSSGVVKTTGELERFAKASNAARAAAKPINIKIASTGLAKVLADIQKMDRALASIGGKSGASQAISQIEIANNKAAISAQKLAQETARTEAAQSRAAIAAQKLADATAKARTATESEAAARSRISQMVDRSIAQQQAEATAIQRTGAIATVAAGSKAAAARQTKDMQQSTDLLNASLAREAAAAKGAAASVNGLAAAQSRANTTIIMAGKGFRLTAHEGLNFSRQMADVGVTAAMGMSPLMIALQQGPQIFDIFQQAGVRTGRSIGSVFAAAARQYAPFIAGLAAAGVAVGALAVAWNAWLNQINSERKGELDAYAASLGLTAEQIEKAGGAAVTAGDLMGGLWDVIKEAVGLEDIFASLGDFIMKTFRAVAQDAKKNISEIVAAIRVIDDVVNFVGDNIGPILSEAFVAGANAAIKAIEGLANKAIGAINKMTAAINPALEMFGFKGVAQIAEVNLGRMESAHAGTIKRGMALIDNYDKYRVNSANRIQSTIDRVEDAAVNRRKEHLKSAVDKNAKDAKSAAAKAAKEAADEWEKALQKGHENFIKGLAGDLKNIGKWLSEWERMVDKDWRELQKELAEKARAAERERKEHERLAEELRRKAFDAAYTIADIIGGAFGDLVGEFANAVLPLVNVSEKFGKMLESFAKGAALGGAVGGVTGSRTGGAIGGGIGQMAGEALAPMLGKLGKFAGPLGAIAGGILGGVIGGLVKSTPRASATVSIIAGEAMDTAIKGSSDKLRKAAGQMADGVINGLLGLADQLGAQLVGDASVSIGMRKKNYRVDPTGQGITKTSKGAIDFGEDQAAAIAYAMQVAIQQGVLGGLSESMKRLIMADGDLQTQIQKALSFKGVFDELAQRDDPAKWAQDEITRWHDAMAKIFKEAGATGDEIAELERLTGLKRADAAKEAADKIAQAERDALQRQNEIRDKNIELLEAQGKVEEAEAMARQARIDDAPEYLRALQQQIEAAHQLREAEEKLAEQRMLAVQNAQNEFGLMERLAGAQGNSDELTRLQRENELRQASDSVTRAYLLQIYAAEDLAAVAAKQAGIDKERFDLEGRLLAVQGDTASLRQRELDALDPANRSLLAMIFALEDMKVAADAAAAAQKAITDEIDGLNRQWLELTGQTQTLRAMDLEILKSDDAREIQKRIWAYQDALERQKAAQASATAAIEDYSKRLEDARNTLMSAYDRESSALQSTIDKFREFGSAIREFRDSLIGGANPGTSLAQARARFTNTSRMAGFGNEASLGAFTEDAQSYLDAARNSGTFEQYQQALASVLAGSNSAIGASEGVASMAQRQLDQMTMTVDALGLLRDDVISFNQALTDYNRVLTEQIIPSFSDEITTSLDGLASKVADGNDLVQENNEVVKVTSETMALALNQLLRIFRGAERDGRIAVTLDGEPVTVVDLVP